MSAGWGCYAGGCKLGARLTDTAYLETLPDWQNAAFFGAPRPAPRSSSEGGGHPDGMEGSEAVATAPGLRFGAGGGRDSSQEVPSLPAAASRSPWSSAGPRSRAALRPLPPNQARKARPAARGAAAGR